MVPVVNSLMQAISASWRTGGRTTHLCGTGIERVVWQRELTRAPPHGKQRRLPKPKRGFTISLFCAFLRNIIAIDACNSVCNIRCTQKHRSMIVRKGCHKL